MTVREYSAYFIFGGLGQNALDEISELTKNCGFEVDVGQGFLEFDYSGRDSSLNVIKYFYALAKIIQNATGELRCQLVDDSEDNEFEFYRIEGGKLIFQAGKIIRGPDEIIKMD